MREFEQDAAELRRRLESPELIRRSIAGFAGLPLRQTAEVEFVQDASNDEYYAEPTEREISDAEFRRLLGNN